MSTNSASFLSNISLVPSWDLLILVVFIGTLFLYGVSAGKNRLMIVLVSIYLSFALIEVFPWETLAQFLNSKDLPSPTAEIFLFLIIIVALAFLIPHSVLGAGFRGGKSGKSTWFQIAVFTICATGLLASMILSFLPAKVSSDINPLILQIFSGAELQFFWVFLPILALVFLRSRKAEM
ncbi:MAG: hypothetical protein ABIF89_02610 [bacterium]